MNKTITLLLKNKILIKIDTSFSFIYEVLEKYIKNGFFIIDSNTSININDIKRIELGEK
jgi:hypothetical protein